MHNLTKVYAESASKSIFVKLQAKTKNKRTINILKSDVVMLSGNKATMCFRPGIERTCVKLLSINPFRIGISKPALNPSNRDARKEKIIDALRFKGVHSASFKTLRKLLMSEVSVCMF